MCLINNFGSQIAWNKFISNILSNLLAYYGNPDFIISTEYTKLFLSIMIVLFIQVPICTLNTIARLHVLSILGCVLILYVILVSIFEFPYYFEQNFEWDKICYFNFNVDFLSVFCIFFFAFGNHSTIMNALSELYPKTDIRINKLVNYTSYSEMILYFITMFVGYFSTYNLTDEIYINREYQSPFMLVGKFLYMGVMICNIGLYYYMIKPFLEYVFRTRGNEKK
jgi:amino acid permease